MSHPKHNLAHPEVIREWPENPLPARNRHEVSLFLEWMKVELISRTPADGGEVCIGRVRGADPEAAPDTYRLVFSLLEATPEDENDFGSGTSQIFDPADFMLLLARMEREGRFGTLGRDVRSYAAHALTHRTTRELELLRRAQQRGLALIEQIERFHMGDGSLPEESVKGSAKRAWLRGARERFDGDALTMKKRVLEESVGLLQLPSAVQASADEQTTFVRALHERCPAYLEELRSAGFAGEHLRHPLFSHAYHLTRFAARALSVGETQKAAAAFSAWATAEPDELFFPAREFADAIFELKAPLESAAALIPPGQRHLFSTYYDALLDPGYNPWSY